MAATGSTELEVASQPACWRQAAGLAAQVGRSLPASGERVAVVGCGTSWFMAQSYAAAREQAGQGETDAFTASEMPLGRHYDRSPRSAVDWGLARTGNARCSLVSGSAAWG